MGDVFFLHSESSSIVRHKAVGVSLSGLTNVSDILSRPSIVR